VGQQLHDFDFAIEVIDHPARKRNLISQRNNVPSTQDHLLSSSIVAILDELANIMDSDS
jgi:hypothetical protein